MAKRKKAPAKKGAKKAADPLNVDLAATGRLIPPAIAELSADGFVRPKCAEPCTVDEGRRAQLRIPNRTISALEYYELKCSLVTTLGDCGTSHFGCSQGWPMTTLLSAN